MLEFGPIELAECQANLPRSATVEDYERAMAFSTAVSRHLYWWIGDMILEMDRRFGDGGAQALCFDNISMEQMQRIVAVSRRVPKENRRSDLSWYHHMQVSRLPKHMQSAWLEKAAEEGWSSTELQRMITEFLKGAK